MRFTYYMPVKVLAGQGCLYEHRALLAELGKKALIVTGAASAYQNGAYDDAVKALKANGQEFACYSKVMSNPTVDCALDAAEAIKREGCGFVLAIGGGSPLDAGKAAAALALNALDKDAVFGVSYQRALPVAAVPTTAGTGSEVTQYAILTNHTAQTKTSIAGPGMFPRLAFLDARYMRGLPRSITVNTAIDALSHLIEGMLSVRASALSDAMAEAGIRAIAECFDALAQDEPGLPVREKLLRASTLGGMVIANTGTTAVHAAGYQLTYHRNIDHGRANGLLIGAYLRFVRGKEAELGTRRIGEILEALGMETLDEFDAALDALLGGRERFTPEEIEAYAEAAMRAKNITNAAVIPEKADILETLRRSLGRR